MRPWPLAILLLASAALVPSGTAHSCAGSAPDCTCPVPDDGTYHSHAAPGEACSGGPGGSASAEPGSASATPAPGLLATLGLVGLAAAVLRRR